VPFLRAGFNAHNTITGIMGWTRPPERPGQFAVAQLRRFDCGDYFWYGRHRRHGAFLVWGEQAVIGTHWGFDLPMEWQCGPASRIDDRYCGWRPEQIGRFLDG